MRIPPLVAAMVALSPLAILGAEQVSRAKPDGYTLMMGNIGTQSINPSLYGKKLSYNPDTAFTPVTWVAELPMVMLAGPAIADLIAGHVDLSFATILESSGHIKSGRLHAIAVTSDKRYPTMPDVPTLSEAGLSGFNTGSWIGLVAPAGTPKEIVDKVARDVREVVTSPEVRPRIKAVGFTGSRGGGHALMRIASERTEPIPVYAEMSSINPVLILPHALKARGEAIAKAFVASLTMGAGQFCTNPGLVLAQEGSALDPFVATAAESLGACPPATMLTPGIHQAYGKGVERIAAHPGVKTVARGQPAEGPNLGQSAFFSTDARNFLADHSLREEVFGASSVLIRCPDAATMRKIVDELEGQLTVTLQMDAEDLEYARAILPALERKAGRVLVNGFPTGVEVAHAMVHGGPFPATSDGRSTSVGSLAIQRFLRPVCYQDFPAGLLPAALRDDNPLGVPRRLDGKLAPPA